LDFQNPKPLGKPVALFKIASRTLTENMNFNSIAFFMEKQRNTANEANQNPHAERQV
jgi:hypothetical protein